MEIFGPLYFTAPILTKNGLGYIWGERFTNSFGHPEFTEMGLA
jgi:hypothetical protein